VWRGEGGRLELVLLQLRVERGEGDAQDPSSGLFVPPMLLQGLEQELLLRPLKPPLVARGASRGHEDTEGGDRQILRLDLLPGAQHYGPLDVQCLRLSVTANNRALLHG
jgi:hypothetical protein